MTFEGRWRIVAMEPWDEDAINLLGPAFIEITRDGHGRFRFIAVEGRLDVRHVERDGARAIEFSWDGNDECDLANGQGWATPQSDRSLAGQIYIHGGGDSAFRAARAAACPDC